MVKKSYFKELLLIFVLVLFYVSSLSAINFTSDVDSLIQKGIEYSIKQNYTVAINIFKNIEKNFPDQPVGYFFHAATLQTKMMDYEIYSDEEEFLQLVDKTIVLAKQQIKQHKNNAKAYFFLGGAYGYLAFYEGKKEDYLKAFKNGFRSIKALEKALSIDNTLYDAYLGIGTYLYYRHRLSKFFTWLPFMANDREKGIRMIKTAMELGTYSRHAALNSFCWIALQERNYKEAWRYVSNVLQKYPSSRIFLWCAAELATKLKKYDLAVRYYREILQSLRDERKLSPYNEATCYQKIAQIFMQQNRWQEAYQVCKKVETIQLNGTIDQKLARKFKRIKAMQKICMKNFNEINSIKGTDP